MNVVACANHLLRYFPIEQQVIPDPVDYPGGNAAVMAAMNEALQELYGLGKPWVRKDERGALLKAPATVPIQVTQGSTAAVIDAGDWQTWFGGCTIVIEGADVDNQLRNATAASLILKYPYAGTTGTKTATVYHDSVTLASDVLQVHEPVRAGNRRIHPQNNASANTLGASTEDFGFHLNTEPSWDGNRASEMAGKPRWFYVDTWSASDTTAPVVRMRLHPASGADDHLSYTAMLKPPTIADVSSTDALPVPFAFIESIFLPIAVKKLRKSPFFLNTAGESEIEDSYRAAVQLLAESDPGRRKGIQIVQKY